MDGQSNNTAANVRESPLWERRAHGAVRQALAATAFASVPEEVMGRQVGVALPRLGIRCARVLGTWTISPGGLAVATAGLLRVLGPTP